MMEVLIVFLLILFTVIFLFYRKSTAKIRGEEGEKIVRKKLNKLDKKKYLVFNDIQFDNNGKKAQIDHVIVSDYGIFVIETKNYNGSVYGSEYKEYWTQYLGRKKYPLYNPIKQNQGHIYALQHVLKGLLPIDFYSIIVFTDRAKVKVKSNTPVVYTHRLLKIIKSYDEVTLNEAMKYAIVETIIKHDLNAKINK